MPLVRAFWRRNSVSGISLGTESAAAVCTEPTVIPFFAAGLPAALAMA